MIQVIQELRRNSKYKEDQDISVQWQNISSPKVAVLILAKRRTVGQLKSSWIQLPISNDRCQKAQICRRQT